MQSIPANIEIIPLPPYTPELNPIEQIWKELRKRGFKNELFQTLDKVVDRLCDIICALSAETMSISVDESRCSGRVRATRPEKSEPVFR
ncbi:MAG: hypothetical protein GXY20_01310 [Clostridiales bacterium]|nr:hypothetical protein [Clostridiales bacterium]